MTHELSATSYWRPVKHTMLPNAHAVGAESLVSDASYPAMSAPLVRCYRLPEKKHARAKPRRASLT